MIYSNKIFIALALAALLLLGSCKKTSITTIPEKTLQEYFEETILNKNFVIQYAKDTVDITVNYSTDTFVLKKGATFYDGEMTGKNGTEMYTGTWSSNEDYGKLIININTPAPPAGYKFINRAWRFTKKSLPIMELAPWGTNTDPKVLHMRRL